MGTKNDNLFGAIDWFPSILSFIGYDNLIPNNLDGKNIMNSLFNNTNFDRTQIILFENFAGDQEISTDSLIEGGMINGDWKYMHGNQPYNCYYPHPPQPFICLNNESVTDKYLFNLKNDPFEANNLVEKYPEIVDRMIYLMVEDAVNNGYKYNEEENRPWNASCPKWHGGNWMHWLETEPANDHRTQC
eukprot:207482_1